MNLVRISIGCILAIPLFFGVRNELRLFRSQSWPSTEGKVLESSLEYGGSGDNSSGTVSAHVVYMYTPKDEYFLGRRISFGYGGTSDFGDAPNILLQYPKDSKVTVYYDPYDFSLCTLQRERGVGGYLLIFVGCGLVAGWLYLIRSRSSVSVEIEPDIDLSGDPDAAIKRRANDGDL